MASSNKRNIAIVGCGPAGLFAAIDLVEQGLGPRILMFDKGPSLKHRKCPRESIGTCAKCKICSITQGFGGAGLFSDGKITLDKHTGGFFKELGFVNSDEELEEELLQVYQKLVDFGAPTHVYGPDPSQIKELESQALSLSLNFLPQKVQHLGSNGCFELVDRIFSYLTSKGVEIATGCGIEKIIRLDEGQWSLLDERGRELGDFDELIVAVGREGTQWLQQQLIALNIKTEENGVDIGVRVEVPYTVTENIVTKTHSFKYVYHTPTFEDRVRTFCVNPRGYVVTETYDGLVLVNGYSNNGKGPKSKNTNFALIVNINLTEPFTRPLEYARNIAQLSNYLGDPVVLQRLGDLHRGRRSTPERIERSTIQPTLQCATPGDLSFVLPHRILTDILETLIVLDKVMPGINGADTLLYGVETKFYSIRTKSDRNFLVEPGLYIIGDGSGVCRGISHSIISGRRAASDIIETVCTP